MRFGKKIMIAAFMMAILITGNSMQTKAVGKFDPTFYATKYPDVWAVLGADHQALYNHYVTCGQKEGRIPYSGAIKGEIVEGMAGATTSQVTNKFNPAFYSTKYPDVTAVIGTNPEALYNHYITCGQREMRQPYPDAPAGQAVTGIATAEEMAKQAAAKPVTHIVRYMKDNKEWRYQSDTNTWHKNGFHRELYYLQQSVRDGDVIVVELFDTDASDLNLTVPVTLSNVTFKGSAGTGIITARGVDEVYVLNGSTGVINGNVENAYVYDHAVANFNSNVNNLYIINESADKQTVSVLGSVNFMQNRIGDRPTRQLYSFRRGTFYMEKGSLKTNSSNYSTYPLY